MFSNTIGGKKVKREAGKKRCPFKRDISRHRTLLRFCYRNMCVYICVCIWVLFSDTLIFTPFFSINDASLIVREAAPRSKNIMLSASARQSVDVIGLSLYRTRVFLFVPGVTFTPNVPR